MTSAANSELLASRSIDHVVVLGANGTMGFGAAALFAQDASKVTLLARTVAKAEAGLEAALVCYKPETEEAINVAKRCQVGSYDGHLAEALSSADLIFEAVAEDLSIKKAMFELVEAHRRPDSIVATVSSGLSINEMARERSESFQRNFCGLHLFNPPRLISGTELIANGETDPTVIDFLEIYSQERLGREMIRANDTPAFAGNRVGFKLLNECAIMAETLGPAMVDKIVGPYTGRVLTPLATIDLVGWDVHRAIVDNIYANTDDEAKESLRLPDYMSNLIANGVLGRKSGGGFFARSEAGKLVLDPLTGEYARLEDAELPDLGDPGLGYPYLDYPDLSYIEEIADLYSQGQFASGLAVLAQAKGPSAALARQVMAGYISYSFERVGEVCDSISDIDSIMANGFGWAPPSLLVDLLGQRVACDMMSEAGVVVPDVLAGQDSTTRFSQVPAADYGRYFP